MLRLWRLFAPGMSAGHLPDAGGTLDQAAIMMDAFDAMTSAEAELKPRTREDGFG